MKNHYLSKSRMNQLFSILIRIICLVIFLGIHSSSSAVTKTWTGAAFNPFWTSSGNWSPFGVPAAGDDVIIPNGTISPLINTSVSVKSVKVNTGATLVINAGTLTINGSTGYGLENLGTVNNAGTIVIDNTNSAGIENQGTFTNQGTLTIGSTTNVGNDGIRNPGIFNHNSGTININRANYRGIYNLTGGTFTNAASIIIGANVSAGSNGIRNNATFNNNTGGTIQINRSTVRAIYNSGGTFTNKASITIGSNQTVGDYGIRNTAIFNNSNGGTINIKRTSTAGIYHSGGTFTNKATITIGANQNVGDYGIRNTSTFNNNNSGTINVNRTSLAGLFNESGTFTNNNTINIGSNNSVGLHGLHNKSNFDNNGVVNIDRTSEDGLFNEAGTFDNTATLNIGQNAGTANITVHGIDNWSTFNNPVGGIINIDNTGDNGIYNWTGSFTNAATINIGKNGGAGNIGLDGIDNRITFNNNSGGVINIENTNVEGLVVAHGSTFNNNGRIDIDNTGSDGVAVVIGTFNNSNILNIGQNGGAGNIGNDGIQLASTSTFNNNTNAVINIDNTDEDGIATWTFGSFNNAATINIGQNGGANNISRFGIQNDSPFNNNGGVINIDNTGNHAITHTNNTFTNAATINIGKNGGANNISGDGLNNLGTFNNNSGGVLNIDETISEGIFNDVGILTNNSGGTINIDNTNHEGIENGPDGTITNNAIINVGQNGGLGNITKEGLLNKGIFNNNTGAALNIDNTGIHGLACRSAATFTNTSNINIGQNGGVNNIAFIGLLSQGIFNNNSGGEIDIDNTLFHGLYNNAGTFNNNSGGLIKVDNTGQDGIQNLGTGTFTNSATIDLGKNGGAANITSDGIWNIATFHNSGGTITIKNTGEHGIHNPLATGYAFHNNNGGIIDIDHTGMDGIHNRNTFNNQIGGVIDIDNTGDHGINSQDGGTVNNFGELNIGKNGTAGNISGNGVNFVYTSINGGGFFNNDGTLTITNATSHSFNISGTFPIFNNNGTLKGNGSFSLDGEDIDGTVVPGLYIGTMSYTGNQTFTGINTMEIEVNGTAPGTQHDVINVSDTAFISGTLSIAINYSPIVNDRIVFLTGTHISGIFNVSPSLPANWLMDYSVPGEVAIVYGVLLPVEWLSFDAKQAGESSVLLSWETASELNNEGFQIEHSVDGLSWASLDFVAGKGTSSELQEYDYTHLTPQKGLNYYRFKQVDFDGGYSYSDIRMVDISFSDLKLSVFPNPSFGIINFKQPLTGNFVIRNMLGQAVWEVSGEEVRSLNLGHLSEGTYLMQYLSSDRKGQTVKIVLL